MSMYLYTQPRYNEARRKHRDRMRIGVASYGLIPSFSVSLYPYFAVFKILRRLRTVMLKRGKQYACCVHS